MDNSPLANRMRPKNLEGFVGQDKLVKKGSFLYNAIESDEVPSLVLWGPPGSGKTTLAFIIANATEAEFVEFSAVTNGVRDLKAVIERAGENKRLGNKTILLVDEIHRWNKAQQDALLPHVERGVITLIGATTENPSFSINSALLSRSRVIVLEALGVDDLKNIIKRALKETGAQADKDTIEAVAGLGNGDARTALNIIEASSKQSKKITKELVKEIIQKPSLIYDKSGDEHYNLISALHKTIRGGDADAGVYYLARILEAGEDPVYVARRLVRFASEDVGLANNSALLLANSVFDTVKNIGMPECNVHLAHLVIYLSKSKKDISAYEAYGRAKRDVEEYGNLSVPLHLRNAPTKLMKELDYGKDYKYTPREDSEDQEYFPDELKGRKYIS